ncbi:hypothetical protein AMS62_19550 [Bacillus sp. FJAT-18019]|nr:hypothetical protein AMS62_19550 [Bacillus sp. FJAT-18019]
MDYSKWIDNNLKIIEIKMIKSMRQKVTEGKNLTSSTFSGTDYLNSGFDIITAEIIKITTEFGKLKFSKKKHILEIREKLKKFVEMKSEYIKNFIESNTRVAIGKSPLEHKVEETMNVLMIYTEIINQERKARVYKFWWDTLKIFITAIIGGLIGGYLKDIFGGSS